MSLTLPPARSVAMHEAHHAAALCLLGMTPKEVRVDWPTADEAGNVTIDWGEAGVDRDKARAVLIATLVGGMTNGFRGWTWPIDPDRAPGGSRRDAECAAVLARYLRFDHVDWAHIIWKANRLARRPEFRRLAVAIADELERVEVLYAGDLQRIHDATREEESCST